MGKGRPVGKSDVLTQEELKMIMGLPDRRTKQGARDYAVLLVLANTPMRKGELVNLNKENLINEGEKKFITYVGLKKKKKKDGEQKPYWLKIPITSEVFDGIKKYADVFMAESSDSPLFRTLGKFGPYEAQRISAKAIDLIVEKYIEDSGIKKRITPHSFRATFTTLRKHRDPWTLQQLGGWANINSIMPYVRGDEQEKEKAALEFSVS